MTTKVCKNDWVVQDRLTSPLPRDNMILVEPTHIVKRFSKMGNIYTCEHVFIYDCNIAKKQVYLQKHY